MSATNVQVLPSVPIYENGRIIPDAFYRFREATSLTRLEGPELRGLLARADVDLIKIKGREHIYGASLLKALEAAK